MSSFDSIIPKELLAPSKEFVRASGSIGLHWWSWNHLERKLSISPALLKVLGYSPEEFDTFQPSIYKNIHPEDASRNMERLKRLFSGEESLYEIEYRVKDIHGEWQWYYNRGTVIQRDVHGKPLIIGGISMDISSQFKYLLSMVEEKEKFEYIFRNTNEAIVIIELLEGKAGNVLDANKAALELFQKSQEDIMKPLPPEILQDELIGKGGVLMNDVFEKGFGRVEQKLKIGDEYVWLDISVHAFTRTGANLMIVIAKDKTPERLSEVALRESEKLYRTLFEAADDLIGLFSMDQEIILINSSFYKTIGYTREEFMSLEWMELIHPEDKKSLISMGGKLLDDGFLAIDYRVKHKQGHYMQMSSKNVLIPGEEGEKDLILTIIRDMTERYQAMEELEQAKERAVESDRLKSAFLANMSHEIRTPMNSIIGFSNLLVNPGLNDDVREMYVQRIVRNSESLLTLISDIIDLAKIESGQLSIIYGKLRLSDLINDLKEYAQDELNRQNNNKIEIITDEKNGDYELETDVIRIAQVMKNLVNNAIKFTDKGSVKIGCERSRNQDNIILYIQDTGIGIAAENFKMIFDHFRQVDGSNTRKFGGTGLGLAICKNLVRMMGGRMWVESETGKGSLFKVELPARFPGTSNSKAAGSSKQLTSHISTDQLSVMVVDDSLDSLELFKEVLTNMGHNVITAETGYEALKLLELSPLPDLILLDIQMPVLNGTDTMRLIRERYGNIKVVAQSAHALVGDRDRFLKEGYDEYLPKPLTKEHLAGVISTLFQAE